MRSDAVGAAPCDQRPAALGATPEESVEIAKSSGYRDGRAWDQWTGWEKDGDGNRWVTTDGMNNLRHYYVKVGYVLVESPIVV